LFISIGGMPFLAPTLDNVDPLFALVSVCTMLIVEVADEDQAGDNICTYISWQWMAQNMLFYANALLEISVIEVLVERVSCNFFKNPVSPKFMKIDLQSADESFMPSSKS